MIVLCFYLLVFTLPIPNHPVLAYYVGPLTILKCLGILCLLLTAFEMFRTASCPPFSKRVSYGWFLTYFLVAFVSCLAQDGVGALHSDSFLYTLSTFSLFLMTTTVIRTLRHLRWAVLIALGSVAWGSVYVIGQWVHFHDTIPGFRTWGGLAGDPNYYAVMVVLWTPLMIFWLMAKRPRWEKWFCFACLSVTVAGFIFAASRGGFLGLSVALLFLLWHTRRRIGTLAIIFLFMLPILLAPGQSAVTRLFHPDYSDDQSTEYRLELWQASERSFFDHPLFGIGMGHFHPSIESNGQIVDLPFHVAHNTYIGLVTDLGLAGFVPFILMLLASLRRSNAVAHRTRAATTPDGRLLHQVAVGFQAGLVGYITCAFFLSTQWQQVFWFAVFLSMCLPAIEGTIAAREDTCAVNLVPDPAALLAHSV